MPTPGVFARSNGVLAGISYASIDRLLSADGTLGYKVLLLMGEFSLALCTASSGHFR